MKDWTKKEKIAWWASFVSIAIMWGAIGYAVRITNPAWWVIMVGWVGYIYTSQLERHEFVMRMMRRASDLALDEVIRLLKKHQPQKPAAPAKKGK